MTRVAGLALVVVALAACSRSSSDRDAQIVVSWAATTEMAADAWLRGRTPTSYFAQTLERARVSLEARARARRDHAPTADVRRRAERLADSVGRMRAALARGDREAVDLARRGLRGERG